MTSVSRFESSLLTILRGVVGVIPPDRIAGLLLREQQSPPCLSRTCVRLMESTLRAGCVRLLARAERSPARFLRDGEVVEGRLWQRHPVEDLALHFSRASLRWLMWMTSTNVAHPRRVPEYPPEQLTAGDEFLIHRTVLTLNLLEGHLGTRLRRIPMVQRNPLVRLFHPDLEWDFDVSFASQLKSSVFLEAFQSAIVRRWTEIEQTRLGSGSSEEIIARGEAQMHLVRRFLAEAQSAWRIDLLRFLLRLSSCMSGSVDRYRNWLGQLACGGRLADRQRLVQSALVVPGIVTLLESCNTRTRDVTYYDQEYRASQLWKSEWARFNCDHTLRVAHQLLREFNSAVIRPSNETGFE